MHENCKANIFHKHHNESLVSLMKQENNASEATFSTKFTFERLFPFMQLENMSSPEIFGLHSLIFSTTITTERLAPVL